MTGRLQHKCPFCRKVLPFTDEEIDKQLMKRVEANDPVAICDRGTKKYQEGDYKSAGQYWKRAADLGEVEAHYQLSCLYHHGQGVEKDEKRELRHLEEAAISGHRRCVLYFLLVILLHLRVAVPTLIPE